MMRSVTALFFMCLLMASYRVSPQNTGSAGCDIYTSLPACPSNPVSKPGYFILLDQSFQNPSKYWNLSKFHDDTGCTYDFMSNPANVTFPSSAWLWNTNEPVGDCPYSRGEIKTMTVDTANHTFRSYYFYGSAYLEAKVRQLYCSPGQGSAMWLWCMPDSDDPTITHPYLYDDSEIDVFETQPNDSNSINSGYHWRMPEDLRKVENYYRVHNTSVSFTDWNVFGVYWCKDSIIWYINNKKVSGMYMNSLPSGCMSGNPTSYIAPDGPFCIRFNSGPNTVGVHEPVPASALPAHLEIEYVRVYKPDGEKAAPIRFFSGTPNQICISENSAETSNTVLIANYYPDATYSWASQAFEIVPYAVPGSLPQHHSGKVKIWVKPGVQAGQSYPIVLTTGIYNHAEHDTVWCLVTDAVPPMPDDVFQTSLIDSPICGYELCHPVVNPTTSSCEFFNSETQDWESAAIRKVGGQAFAFFGRYDPLTRVSIKYREKNACGYSGIRNSRLVMPVPLPGSCGW